VVFHFAARTGVGQSMYDIRQYVDVNCTGTATLLDCLLGSQRTRKRLVLSSSRAVYGEGTHQCLTHGEIYPDARPRERLAEGKFEVLCHWCGVEARVVPTREDRPLKPVSIYGWTKKHQEDLCIQAAATYRMPTTILRYFNVYGSRQCLRTYAGVVSIFTQLKTGRHNLRVW
jgi:dTDP-L-rhamnose 4-epimerase